MRKKEKPVIHIAERKFLIGLISSAINSAPPPEPDESLDLEFTLFAAKKHRVEAAAYHGLVKLRDKIPPDIYKKWTAAYGKEVVRDELFRGEYSRIANTAKRESVTLVPLKGIFLKTLYPSSEMRSMSDIDLLFFPPDDPSGFMSELGYEKKNVPGDSHDVYTKEPSLCVEWHYLLFSGEEFAPVFKSLDRHIEKNSSGCALSPEYFYIYMLLHTAKHFFLGGIGIRAISDIYVYRKKVRFDERVVASVMEKAGFGKFRETVETLADMWFGEKTVFGDTEPLERYVFGSGALGVMPYKVGNAKSDGNGAAGYFIHKLFPSPALMKCYYPFLRKAPLLLPFYWLRRIPERILKNGRGAGRDIYLAVAETAEQKMKLEYVDSVRREKPPI